MAVNMGAESFYNYAARVVRWVDGDTVEADVDLGFTVWVRVRFRLYGIDTPERGQPGYDEATMHCIELAPAGSMVEVSSLGKDKYGRWLSHVINGEVSVGHDLLAHGLAREYFGGPR